MRPPLAALEYAGVCCSAVSYAHVWRVASRCAVAGRREAFAFAGDTGLEWQVIAATAKNDQTQCEMGPRSPEAIRNWAVMWLRRALFLCTERAGSHPQKRMLMLGFRAACAHERRSAAACR
jgi:hypothetical protein